MSAPTIDKRKDATLLKAKRLFSRKIVMCQRHVGYLFSGRACRKLATWKIGREYLCGTHANALAIRLLMVQK